MRQEENVTLGVTTQVKSADMSSTMDKKPNGQHYIRAWRKRRGLSLRKLADRMEVEPGVPLMSHANIGRIETGDQPYSEETLHALAQALDCSILDLLSVDPTKDGEVVDLMRRISERGKSEDALAVLRALAE